MTCRIQLLAAKKGISVLRVSGHIQSEHVNKIEELISRESGQVVLDLSELTLVDRDAVSYLAKCKLRGIELKSCPSFLIEWISKEQAG